MCVNVHVCEHPEEVQAVKLQQGCFRQNSAPEGTRAITHNSPALIGCIQRLYWKLSSFCRPQVPITSHLPFSSHCFATQVCMVTHRRTDSCFFTEMPMLLHVNTPKHTPMIREQFFFKLNLRYLVQIPL